MEDRPFNLRQIERPLSSTVLALALTWGACVCDSASAQHLSGVEVNGGGFIQPAYAAHIGLSFAQQWG